MSFAQLEERQGDGKRLSLAEKGELRPQKEVQHVYPVDYNIPMANAGAKKKKKSPFYFIRRNKSIKLKRRPTAKRPRVSMELLNLAKEKRISDSTLNVLSANGYTTIDDVKCIDEPDLEKLDIVLLAQKSLVRKTVAELNEQDHQDGGSVIVDSDSWATSRDSEGRHHHVMRVIEEERERANSESERENTTSSSSIQGCSAPQEQKIESTHVQSKGKTTADLESEQSTPRHTNDEGPSNEVEIKNGEDCMDEQKSTTETNSTNGTNDMIEKEQDYKDFISCGLALLEDMILDEKSDSLAYCRHLSFCTIKAMSDSTVADVVRYDNALRLRIERTGSSFPKRPDEELCAEYLIGPYDFHLSLVRGIGKKCTAKGKTENPTVKARRKSEDHAAKARRQSEDPTVKGRRQSEDPTVKARRQSEDPTVKARRQSEDHAAQARIQSKDPTVKARRQSKDHAAQARIQSEDHTVKARTQSGDPTVSARRHSENPTPKTRWQWDWEFPTETIKEVMSKK
ncbi:uncharacterized protein LOC135499728 [Lineus longissimus]|uniref:uncharacterized protein LOC135499728 n=1 Tax=Lineus longissimus TaxID=88925 RepID=UPI00315D89F1